MSSTAAVSPDRSFHPIKAAALAVVVLVAFGFVIKYVLHYYFNYNAGAFADFWPQPRRSGILLHISAGTVALLLGPWQFSRRLRQRHLQWHRVIGRSYLIAVLLAATGAFLLAFTTRPWAWQFGLFGLALAWVSTSGMAYYAIKRRQIQLHREWMVRSYVVTFAFVTFRLFDDMGPTSHLMPEMDRALTFIWACWALPLLVTEVVLQLRRMRHTHAPLR